MNLKLSHNKTSPPDFMYNIIVRNIFRIISLEVLLDLVLLMVLSINIFMIYLRFLGLKNRKWIIGDFSIQERGQRGGHVSEWEIHDPVVACGQTLETDGQTERRT